MKQLLEAIRAKYLCLHDWEVQAVHKIRKDDLVKVIAGKDKDKTGKVLSVKDGKVLVEGCNMVTKHSKPNAANPQGGIVNIEIIKDYAGIDRVVLAWKQN